MRRLIIQAIVVFYGMTVSAQVKVPDLRKAKDYVNARVTFLMLSEYVKKNQDFQGKWESIKPILESNKIEHVLTYEELSKALSKDFPRSNSQLSEPINKIIVEKYSTETPEKASNGIVDECYQILEKSYPEIHTLLIDEKSILAKETLILLPLEPEQKPTEDLSGRQQSDIEDISEAPGFFSFKYFNFWVLFPLIMVVILILFFSVKVNNKFERHSNAIRHLNDNNDYNRNFVSSNSSVNEREFRRFKDIIENKISELNTEIEKLQRELRRPEPIIPISRDEQKDNFPTTQPQKIQENVFYMSSPSNNYFPLTAKSPNKENTLYKFIIKGNKNEAEYEVINDGAPISLAVNHASNYIEPACNAENSPSNSLSRIITMRPGKVSFDGEKWIINNKAEIRYE